MSDIFNHALDAWESYDRPFEGLGGGGSPPNPLFYHQKVNYVEILVETDKAYRFRYGNGSILVWIPKSVIRRLDTENKTMYVHRKTLLNCLSKAVRYWTCSFETEDDT